MDSTNRNKDVLERGFAKAMKAIEDTIFMSLYEAAEDLLKYVGTIHPRQGWSGFTGNTQTSYACGIYIWGRLECIVIQDNWHEPTRRRMLKLGEYKYLENPYEGGSRVIRGMVYLKDNHGLNVSLEFLQSYKMDRRYCGLVMCTGTEYSLYLEQVRKVDVLTDTFKNAGEIIIRNFKPIPK